MAVKFTDNSMQVKAAISAAVKAYLYEAGGELRAQTIRNSRTDTGQTKGTYDYNVEIGSNEATLTVGSPFENALWEEFGTGEYALNGDGRKTPWVYKNRRGEFRYTTGKKPNRPLYRAFTSLQSKLQQRLKTIMKGI